MSGAGESGLGRAWSAWALPTLLAGVFLFRLGQDPLADNNEGLYAQIPREMLSRGDLVVPFLNGVPYIEKPPLLYWLTAASYRIFGVSEWSARLPVALAAIAACLAIAELLRRSGRPRAGALAATILATSPAFVVFGHVLLFDMLFTAALAASLLALYQGLELGSPHWLRAFYVFLALAVLAKGLAALVLVGLTSVLFLWWRGGSPGDLRRILDPLGLLLFALLAVPWHLAAAIRQESFAWFYFVNEHLLRFLGRREPHDYFTGSVLYYVPRVILGLAPWIAVPPILPGPRGAPVEAGERLRRFLWAWFLAFLVFFSLSRAKANYYLLTAAPPLAALVALRLDAWIDARAGGRLRAISVAAVLLSGASLFAAARVCAARPATCNPLCAGLDGSRLAGVGVGAAAALALALGARRRLTAAALAPAVMIVPTLAILYRGAAKTSDCRSRKGLAADLRALPPRPVFLYHDYERLSSFLFYHGARLPIVASGSRDLLFGERQAGTPEWFPTAEAFREQAARERVYVVVQARRLAAFRERVGTGFCPVLERGDALVLASGACPDQEEAARESTASAARAEAPGGPRR